MKRQREGNARAVRRDVRPGCRIATFSGPRRQGATPVEEIRITALPLAGESPAAMARRLAGEVASLGASVTKHDVFAPLEARDEVLRAWADAARGNDCPITWVGSASPQGAFLAGMCIWAVKGAEVETIRTADGRPLGRAYSDGSARYCILGGIGPSHPDAERHVQARETFQNMLAALESAGMRMTNVLRTWFYLDRILEWYGLFNEVRTAFFRQTGVIEGLVPASTGIGGGNPSRAALTAACLAAAPSGEGFSACALPSPLQGPAPAYGSSFARAVEVAAGGARTVYVSGTASIAPDGRTAFAGDVSAQIELTLRVVEAILRSRGMDFDDVARAVIYLRDLADAAVWERRAEEKMLLDMPAIVTGNDICRPDLLFEIEVDAFADR